MPPLSKDDRIEVTDPQAPFHGSFGTVNLVEEDSPWPVNVHLDGQPEGKYFCYGVSEITPVFARLPLAMPPGMPT